MLLAYQAYTSQFSGATGRLVAQFFTFRTLGIHLDRLAEIVHAPPEEGADDMSQPSRRFEAARGS